MEAKKQMVSLEANGQSQDFTFEHAEKLLQMSNNGGWKLTQDSQFKFENNGLRIRENKRGTEITDKKGGDKQSNTTAAKD